MKIRLVFATLTLSTAVAPHAQAQALRASKSDASPSNTTIPKNTPTAPAEPSGKLDYRNPAADPLIPVETDKRKPITDDPQATVVELLELFHDSKQSH